MSYQDKVTTKEKANLKLADQQFEHMKVMALRDQLSDMFVIKPSRGLLGGALQAPAATAPDPSSLNDILNSAITAPGTTSIASVPNAPNQNDLSLLQQVQTLDSYISILTAFCVYNHHPAPYDITDKVQASEFTQAVAKYRNYVTTGGIVKALAAYLPIRSSKAQSLSKSTTSADIHVDLLAAMFAGFNLPAAALTQLDAILTGVVGNLKSLSLKFESTNQTLDHFLTYYYFKKVTGMPSLHEVHVRMFYLKVNQKSWEASIGKSSIQHFTFDMNYIDIDCGMSSALVQNDMSSIIASIKKLTGKDQAAINKLMNMKAIRTDPQ